MGVFYMMTPESDTAFLQCQVIFVGIFTPGSSEVHIPPSSNGRLQIIGSEMSLEIFMVRGGGIEDEFSFGNICFGGYR